MLRELDRYAPPGSTLTVLTAYGEPVVPAFQNLAVTVVKASSTNRAVLEEHVGADLDQIIVLCYDRDLEVQTADSRTLVTLLHVRDILRKVGSETPVVSEMIDDRNRVLASVADVDDIVVSGEIVCLLVTQLSEDGRLEAVFKELLGAEGSEIYLRPAEWYVQPGDDVSWATVVAGAARRNETAIGLKSALLAEPGLKFGVVVNPPKSQTYTIGAGRRGRGARRGLSSVRPRGRRLAGPARCHRVERGRAAHVDHRPAAAAGRVRTPRGRWRRGWPTTPFALVLTSPRERARRTAELAGFATAEVDEDLAEWAYGDYEGITTDEIRESVPGWTVWTHPCPGGETADQVSARLDRVVARCRAADGDALVFGHGHALRALAARWLRLPVSDGRLLGSTPAPSRCSATSARTRWC